MTSTINWMPEHFPIGTVGVAKIGDDDAKEFTVVSTQRNGIKSFVVKTTEFDNRLNLHTFFNLCYVTKIIKRGSGGNSFHRETYHCDINNRRRIATKTEARRMILDRASELGLRFNSKNHWLCWGLGDCVVELIEPYRNRFGNSEMIDFDKILSELAKQSFVRTLALHGPGFETVYINKKRAKKWMASNFRRMLQNTVQAQRKEEEAMQEDYMREFEEDY